MAESYDDNTSNYGDGPVGLRQETTTTSSMSVKSEEPDDADDIRLSEKAHEYLRDLLAEKNAMNSKYSHAERLLDEEIAKVQTTGRIPHHEPKFVDIYREKRIRVVVKVLVPVKEHPKFNFVGKLLGPKGNSMKRLKQETMCKMAVAGRGSMRDRKKEEELRQSSDPKYAHLKDDLHVEISALASPAEAYARTAYALAEVRKYLIPDSNDCIHQEQMRELVADGTLSIEDVEPAYSKYPRHLHQSRCPSGSSAYPPSSRPFPPHSFGPARPPHMGGGPPMNVRPTMPAKQKILSILDRARNAMDESYAYEESGYNALAPPPSHYDAYSGYGHPSAVPSGRNHPQPSQQHQRYDAGDYDAPEYRRGDYYHREANSYPGIKRTGAFPPPFNLNQLAAQLHAPNGLHQPPLLHLKVPPGYFSRR